MSAPTFEIKGKSYDFPSGEKLGELRLIELVTGMTHREWRARALEQQERIDGVDLEELDEVQMLKLLDDMVMLGNVAVAVRRANAGWTDKRVKEFVDGLGSGEVRIESGDADPPTAASESSEKLSSNGTESAPLSSSGSDEASSESPTLLISGDRTSDT